MCVWLFRLFCLCDESIIMALFNAAHVRVCVVVRGGGWGGGGGGVWAVTYSIKTAKPPPPVPPFLLIPLSFCSFPSLGSLFLFSFREFAATPSARSQFSSPQVGTFPHFLSHSGNGTGRTNGQNILEFSMCFLFLSQKCGHFICIKVDMAVCGV